MEGYDRLGKLKGAIATQAEDTWALVTRQIDPEVVKRALSSLVVVSETGDYARWQKPVSAFSEEEIKALVPFVDSRLLIKNENYIEISHEALFRAWDRFARWLFEMREDLTVLRDVTRAATIWKSHDESPDDLLRGAGLERATGMRDRLVVDLSKEATNFIDASTSKMKAELDLAERRRSYREIREATLKGFAQGYLTQTRAELQAKGDFASYARAHAVENLLAGRGPWHPEPAEYARWGGATHPADIYRFPCCGREAGTEDGGEEPFQFVPTGCQEPPDEI